MPDGAGKEAQVRQVSSCYNERSRKTGYHTRRQDVRLPSVKLDLDQRRGPDLVIVGAFERTALTTEGLPKRLANAALRCFDRPGFKALDGQVQRCEAGGSQRELVEVHGLGKKTAFDEWKLRRWLARVAEEAAAEGQRRVVVLTPDHPAAKGQGALSMLTEVFLTGYRFDRYRKPSPGGSLREIRLLPPPGQQAMYEEALPLARKVATAVAWTRDLGNTPPNEASPVWMEEQARNLAERFGMDIQVLGPDELAARGMGGILAVGGGSANPPRLVRLEWGEGEETVALVGKGVTFDTGGISIKPSRGMEEMKYDKCGACTVLGIAQAAAGLKIPLRFRVYVPLVENMPDGRSYRPGDIVRCYNGKTVEVLDTDAEGRLILADALAWAAEERPDTLIEYSTLTGSSVVALGHHGAALYAPADELADELLAASKRSGDRLWRMPLWPEFGEEMKGVHADLRNLGSRWGGANNAAAFLANFVGRVQRWAHLDIAGTAYEASRESSTSGATGFGVPLAIDWLLRRTERF
jgi:leucyl aminopeptidase